MEHLSRLEDYVRSSVEAHRLQTRDELVFVIKCECRLGVPVDYAAMMHWSCSGHRKVAAAVKAGIEEHVPALVGLNAFKYRFEYME